MAKKIEEFERLYKQAQADRAKLSSEIEDLIRREAGLNDAANTAAASGDVDAYMAKAKEKERVSATIYVKRMQLDKLKPFSDADVLASWKEYVERYNKAFDKALAEYEKESASLRSKYRDLVELQNSALRERERFSAFTGEPLDGVPMSMISMDAGRNLPKLNFRETPDMHFCRVGCKTPAEDDELCSLFNHVIRLQKPYTRS